MVRRLVGVLIFGLGMAAGQNAPLLSPQAAFDRASSPVEIVRRSEQNWSDVEKASLAAAVTEAKEACEARSEIRYTGEDLIGLARLCALGKQWQPVFFAGTDYLAGPEPKPQIGLAYAFVIQADLNLDHEKAAVFTARDMLKKVPYGPLVDEVMATTIQYLQFAYTTDALSVATMRHQALLKALASGGSGVALHTLYSHALDFPALEQYCNEPNVAGVLQGEIEAALPQDVGADEAILIAGARKRYGLLGKKFPALPGAVYLMSATETPLRQPSFGPATVFFLFPPWCAQCVKQAQQLVPAMVRIAVVRGPDYKGPSMYALLADATPVTALVKPPVARAGVKAKAVETEDPKTISEQLRKTPTLVVAPSVLADFDATDFPFLIATDKDGVIRLMMPGAPDNALVQGGIVDQMVATILATWPVGPGTAKEAK